MSALVVKHEMSIDHTSKLLDWFEATDWKNFTSVQDLRRKTKKLLGQEVGDAVFGALCAAAPPRGQDQA